MLLFIRSHRCNCCCCCCCCCCCLFVYLFLSMLLLLFSFRSYNAMLLWNTVFPSVVYCCYYTVLRKGKRDSLVFRDSIPNTYTFQKYWWVLSHTVLIVLQFISTVLRCTLWNVYIFEQPLVYFSDMYCLISSTINYW